MSLSGTRATIAAALTAVGGGVRGHKFRPSIPAPGDAYPLMGPAERGPGDAFAITWRVVLVGGPDEAAAEVLFDAKLPTVVAALEGVGYVSAWRPASLKVEGVDVPAMVIDILREADPT